MNQKRSADGFIKDLLSWNYPLINSTFFFILLPEKSMEKNKIKIGILTFHRAHNYGAYLQACALCNRLNQEPDIDCEIIDFRMRKEVDFYYQFRDRNKFKKLLRPRKTDFLEKKSAAFERAQCEPVLRLSPDSLVSDSQEEFVEFIVPIQDGAHRVLEPYAV